MKKTESGSPQKCMAKALKVMVMSYVSEILMGLEGKKIHHESD